MKTAFNKVNRRIYRDFGEIENLQGIDSKIDRFFDKTYEFIEYNLRDYLNYCRPEWEFLDNINSTFKKDTYYWLLQPLSGKENFKRSIPIFSSSVSVFFNDKVIASSIYDPLRNDFYFTEEGKGAFLNDHRIRVSNRKFLENSLISFQSNNSNLEIDNLFSKYHLPLKNFRVFNSSTVSVSWLCNGKLDCFIGINMDQPFIKSSKLLLRESGGFFLETNLNENNFFICANPTIHKKIIKILN
jgi:myo-inositol-1(or 4)-monophosphatase